MHVRSCVAAHGARAASLATLRNWAKQTRPRFIHRGAAKLRVGNMFVPCNASRPHTILIYPVGVGNGTTHTPLCRPHAIWDNQRLPLPLGALPIARGKQMPHVVVANTAGELVRMPNALQPYDRAHKIKTTTVRAVLDSHWLGDMLEAHIVQCRTLADSQQRVARNVLILKNQAPPCG